MNEFEKRVYEFALANMNMSYGRMARHFGKSESWIRNIIINIDPDYPKRKPNVTKIKNAERTQLAKEIIQYLKQYPKTTAAQLSRLYNAHPTKIYAILKENNITPYVVLKTKEARIYQLVRKVDKFERIESQWAECNLNFANGKDYE